MFVWNHFTNDARVMRECLALSDDHYSVNLIAIGNRGEGSTHEYERVNERFRVYRVPMYPLFFETFKYSKLMFLVTAIIVLSMISLFIYKVMPGYLLVYGLIIIATFGILSVKTVRSDLVKLIRSIRMTFKGYFQHADIYHSNDINTLLQGIICAKLRFNKRKLIYDSHEVQTDRTGYNSDQVEKIERFLLRFVDATIVENDTRAKKHEELYGYKPRALYNYAAFYEVKDIEKVNLNEELNIDEDDKILLYQGGIQAGRGLELLIDMMHEIEKSVLVLIGDGQLKPLLERKVIDEHLGHKVRFVKKVHLSELPKYTKNGYIGFQVLQNVNYNHYSATSNKVFEYIMAHVPIISCDFPEVKKVVEGRNVGIAIDASNINEIIDAVKRLLNDENLRAEYALNCKNAKYIYNWDIEKMKLLEIYQNLTITSKEDLNGL